MENEEGPASKKRKMSPSISNGNNSNEGLPVAATATAGASGTSISSSNDATATMASSKRSLSTLSPDATVTGEQDPHEASRETKFLSTLTSSLAAMRALITCKICDRLSYEPFVLACGHTYCYSCLSEWLSQPAQGRSGTKRSCPDCRAEVKQQPAPNFVVREMTSTFISNQELLILEGEDETKEQHEQWARDEGEIIAKDREKGMLFKGIFGRRRRLPRLPVVDPEDGVERCPDCHWELEHGFCNHCGLPVDDFLAYGDSEFGGFDLAEEDWYGHDDFSIDYNENPLERSPGAPGEVVRELFGRRVRRPPLFVSVDTSEDEDDDDDDNEEEEDPTMDGFVQDDRISYESGSDGHGLPSDEESYSASPRRVRRRVPVVIDDDDEDESDDDGTAPPGRRSTVVIDDSSDEDSSSDDEDDEDEAPVTSHRSQPDRRRVKRSRHGNASSHPTNSGRRRPAPIAIDSDSDSDSDSDEDGPQPVIIAPRRRDYSPDHSNDSSDEDIEGTTLRAEAWGGFSPPEQSSSDDDDHRSQSYDINNDENEDDDNPNNHFYHDFETRIGGGPNGISATGAGYDSSSTYGDHAADDVEADYHYHVPPGYGADGDSDGEGYDEDDADGY